MRLTRRKLLMSLMAAPVVTKVSPSIIAQPSELDALNKVTLDMLNRPDVGEALDNAIWGKWGYRWTTGAGYIQLEHVDSTQESDGELI